MIHAVYIIALALALGIWFFFKTRSATLFDCSDKRTTNMAIALAFAVAASDGDLSSEEIKTIEHWAHDNILDSQKNRTFHKALTATRAFFYAGNKIDSEGMCSEIKDSANLAQRYDILKLCMDVTSSNGLAKAKQLVFLRNIANWLDLDSTKVSMLMEAHVPINIHEVKDAEFILGINNQMPQEQAASKLNREYKKWNGRVTNPDKKIRKQAKMMIELIASLKNEYLKPQT